MRRILNLLITFLLVAGCARLWAADQPAAAGLGVGKTTQSFVVLDVTGPHKGEAICYVCEYRGAPTVLGFFQDASDETAGLIVRLNELVQQNSDKKLKGVAVMISGPEQKPWLEKLAQDKAIKIPLVVFRKGKDDLNMKLYKLNAEAKNTIIVSINRQVSANLSNVKPENFNQVVEATSKMLSEKQQP